MLSTKRLAGLRSPIPSLLGHASFIRRSIRKIDICNIISRTGSVHGEREAALIFEIDRDLSFDQFCQKSSQDWECEFGDLNTFPMAAAWL